ncbi:hypothetical protein LPW11_02120 [Geomonas sp. RF6]|uniref:hypothetical protein n=1 Tax=Geomonas sp. RF6 TaxID=2897342 RepID=UPI001E38C074|nr:hypothetical protein [Geomonas sp. RF6]UFS70993.1 hypothetical protein LPW11_02120 [Geomonas sp. RF6]
MIYLTNDTLDHAVYFEFCGKEPHTLGSSREQRYFGLLGNGIYEVPVTLKSHHGRIDVDFGRSELFSLVEEDDVRRIIGEMVKERTLH